MKSGRPALRLPDLAARLLQGLALEVIPEKQLTLLLGELLHRPPHPTLQLLQLQPLVRRQCLIRQLQPLGRIEAGGKHHGQPGDSVGDVPYIIVNRPPPVASPGVSICKISQIGSGPFRKVSISGVLPAQDSHLAKTVKDGALDSVVRKSQKIRTNFRIEAIRGFQQADLPVRNQLF